MDKLADITARGWIMAYFIRSDGERFLLGTGAYDFKSDLQHFQPNTMANDIVELQGADGQLIAGQVRRSATQSFNGYVGDSTQNRERIEELRRDFLMFFRKNFFYKTVYIYPNGTAIQRKRGYLVDAPSVPELYQFFPEYHVALNYEDPNYYEYAEDAQGDEIFANILAITLTTPSAGGLVWDAIGAVSHGYIWSNPQTASGSSFQITGIEGAPLTLTELTGNATQNGTPTPDAPVAVNTTTGENVVKITGKNLFDKDNYSSTAGYFYSSDTLIGTGSPAHNILFWIPCAANTKYSITIPTGYGIVTKVATSLVEPANGVSITGSYRTEATVVNGYTTGATAKYLVIYLQAPNYTIADILDNIVSQLQLELGSTATTYEPYQGQEYEVNLGKNLFDKDNANIINAYINGSNTLATSSNDRVALIPVEPNTTYSITAQRVGQISGQGADDFAGILIESATTPTIGTSGTRIFYAIQGDLSQTFTTNASQNWLALKVANIVRSDYSGTLATIQLELGSATAYAPYFTPIELAKIGTYQDRIYKNDGKWYIEKQVGKVVFDGSESWNITSNGNSFFRTLLDATLMPNRNTIAYAVSNYYTAETYNRVTSVNPVIDYGLSLSDSTNRINIRNKDITTTADFQTWLSTHPTTVYYALATPTTTEITDSTLLAQLNFIANLYGGTNNIMLVGTGAQGEIGVEYMTEVDTDGAGYEWQGGGGGGGNTITLDAVEAVRPVWEVIGPATNPTLTNITTGETISFDGTVPAGQTLTVDMDARTATMAGANVFQFITGDWLRLEPGNNRMSYTATGTTEPSTLSWNGVVG